MMTRAQQADFDRAAQALLQVTGPMSPEDVIQFLAAFVDGRADMGETEIDRLHSVLIGRLVARRLQVAA